MFKIEVAPQLFKTQLQGSRISGNDGTGRWHAARKSLHQLAILRGQIVLAFTVKRSHTHDQIAEAGQLITWCFREIGAAEKRLLLRG